MPLPLGVYAGTTGIRECFDGMVDHCASMPSATDRKILPFSFRQYNVATVIPRATSSSSKYAAVLSHGSNQDEST